MKAKHSDLSSVFAAQPATADKEAPRGAKLAGLLSSKPVSDTKPRVSAPVKASNGAKTSTAASTTSDSSPASDKAVLGPQNRGAYLPHDVLETLKARRHQERSTYTDILIDAFDQVSDEVLKETFSPTSSPAGGGMPRRRRTTDDAKSGTQIQLRLDSQQEQWLDSKQDAVGAPSRSALVTTAYQLYFAQASQKKKR